MKLTGRTNYSDARSRKELAKFLSNTIEGENHKDIPYCPNDHDDYYWTLDNMNNWKVKFYEDDPFSFSIIHRYQCEANQIEESLAGWLKYRMNVAEV